MKISDLQASNPGLYNTDKFSCHSYADFYDAMFDGKENEELRILEVGVNDGGSIRLWHDYLKNASIIGVDINDQARANCDGLSVRVFINIGDAYVGTITGDAKFDVIIDDGSHALQDQICAIRTFPAYLKPGGVLVIEDIPEGCEDEILKHVPEGGTVEVRNLRTIKGRWDDCLIVFKKD
jgi:SAM-dependent methyltransferase